MLEGKRLIQMPEDLWAKRNRTEEGRQQADIEREAKRAYRKGELPFTKEQAEEAGIIPKRDNNGHPMPKPFWK